MDSKTLSVLEYPKIFDRLAANCAFSASVDLARRGGVIDPQGMLDIKSTLISAREWQVRKTS